MEFLNGTLAIFLLDVDAGGGGNEGVMRVRSDLRQGRFDFFSRVHCNECVSGEVFHRMGVQVWNRAVGIWLNLDVSMVGTFERESIGKYCSNRFVEMFEYLFIIIM